MAKKAKSEIVEAGIEYQILLLTLGLTTALLLSVVGAVLIRLFGS